MTPEEERIRNEQEVDFFAWLESISLVDKDGGVQPLPDPEEDNEEVED